MKLIDNILTEWAYRVHDGMPNIDNPLHIVKLKEVLRDDNFTDEFINELISNLTEESFYARSKKSGKIVQYKNKDNYEKGIEDGSHEKVDREEAEKELGGDKKDDEKPPSKPKITKIANNPFAGDNDNKERNISLENQKIVSDFDTRITKNDELLSGDKKQLVKEVSEKIKVLYGEDATPEQQKEAAQWMVDNAGFSANQIPSTGKRKAYLNKLGGDRKILGDGTQNTENLVKKVESLVGGLKTLLNLKMMKE